MNLAWCMIALSLVGADEKKPGKPQPPGVATLAIPVKTAQTQELWPMDLATATRIAFDNSENVRLIQLGTFSLNAAFFPLNTVGPITIARLNADTPVARFKADAMALARSVEQQYWNLVQAQAALESAEHAVQMTRDLLQKVSDNLTLAHCDPGVAEAAEAAQRLEQFNIEATTRKADVVTAERALRKILGLPPTDNRQIVPTTKPSDGLVSFDWDTCVNELLRDQPDNVQQQAVVRLAELYLLLARNQLIPLLDAHTIRQLNGTGPLLESSQALALGRFLETFGPVPSSRECVEGIDLSGNAYMDSLTWQRGLILHAGLGRGSNTRQAQYILLKARARQRQVFDQTTHSLARLFVEVDANYKQYAAAQRLQAAAAQRLDVQRAYYQEGRITIDRFLDAFSQYATAVMTEFQDKTAYNISLAALSEAKGTLLADRGITVLEDPRTTKAGPQ